MKKILIVEDDHNLGLMIKDILEFKGHEVILSKKPEETIENLLNNDIGLVLMDKLMSGIDGTDVCVKIRNEGAAISKTPILMMSALPDARADCMKAGATDFIAKPFEMIDLQNRVERLLNLEFHEPRS